MEDADGSCSRIGAARRLGGRRAGIGETKVCGVHVGIVLGGRTGNEMIGVYAASDVAAVAKEHALANRPVLRLPGRPVRDHRSLLIAETAVAARKVLLPDKAAAQRIGLGQVGDVLSERPSAFAIGPRPGRAVGAGAFLPHEGNLTETARNHLFWSLEVQRPPSSRPERSGVEGPFLRNWP